MARFRNPMSVRELLAAVLELGMELQALPQVGIPFAKCTTAAATATKVVAAPGFTLTEGIRVVVKFTITNTATNPKLKVGDTGAAAIKLSGVAVDPTILEANRIFEFIYVGNAWEILGGASQLTLSDQYK